MKSIIKSLPAILASIIAVVGIAYAAGSLTAPSGTPAATSYTLGDIYNKILDITFSPSSHSVSTTTDPATTFASLTEIYTALDAATTTLVASNIANGETIFGVTGTLTAGSSAAPLKTGQTTCYDPSGNTTNTISCSGSGQDGQYQSGVARSYTDNTNGTISDNATGLMWVKDPSEIPGGTWGTPGSPSNMSFANAITNCEALSYAGYTDWRLPNIMELQTLVDFGVASPTINTTYFPNTQSGDYWSGTTAVGTQGQGWELSEMTVKFSTGYTVSDFKENADYARCVRG